MKKTFMFIAPLLCAFLVVSACQGRKEAVALQEAFLNPPQSARPMVWWHWMNGNISREGIRKDIEWMHRVGVGGFHLFDAGLDTPQVVPERLGFMTPEWKAALREAGTLADSLGMEVAIASSPGWSCTGGPWVAPQDAMKKLTWQTLRIQGGVHFEGTLPAPLTVSSRYQYVPLPYEHNHHQDGPIPESWYEDIAVYAVRLPAQYATAEDLGGRRSSGPGWIQDEVPRPEGFRAVSVRRAGTRGGGHGFPPRCVDSLQLSQDGIHFSTLCGITQGAVPQQTEVIPCSEARFWRLKRGEPLREEGDFTLLRHVPVNHFEEKAGIAATGTVAQYPTPPEAEPSEVIDLSACCHDGVLRWDAPEGEWMIYRFSASLTGKKNHPASPEATGLEVDKLDKEAFSRYLHHYLDLYKEAAGGLLGRRGIQYLMIDSYESGGQNWTPSLPEEFRRRRGKSTFFRQLAHPH